MFRKIVFTVILVIFILSIVNAIDESENPVYVFLVSVLAILPLLLSACIVFFIKMNVRIRKVMEICVYIVGAAGLACYAAYAANGATAPDTSAHMHLVLFPTVYMLFSFFVMAVGAGVSFIVVKR